ncbi:MAG TPA: hypothetical protein VNT32_08550, partial [Thermoleophilaceae bacterium]|nr:hypothetical protein [Thermoleophilaceae bacterium]
PPPAVVAASRSPVPAVPARLSPAPPEPPLPALVQPVRLVPVTPPPPPFAQPIPPTTARVYQVEEKREEEAAPEDSRAYARYAPEDHAPYGAYAVGLLLLAAFAGATVRPGPRGNAQRVHAAPVSAAEDRPPRTRHRRTL